MENDDSESKELEINILRRSLDLSVCIRSDDMIVLEQRRFGIHDQQILVEPDQVELLIKWLNEAHKIVSENTKV